MGAYCVPALPIVSDAMVFSPRELLPSVLRTTLAVAALFSLVASPASAEPAATPEYTLKAAFIYNFARFTNWTERQDKLLHFCVLGRDPFGNALDTIDNKEVGQMRLVVRRLRHAEEAMRSCQIVFITAPEMEDFSMQPEHVRLAHGVLTIADHEGSARRGVIVELTTDERRVGFEFNRESARQTRVEVSSKLLRLARKVY